MKSLRSWVLAIGAVALLAASCGATTENNSQTNNPPPISESTNNGSSNNANQGTAKTFNVTGGPTFKFNPTEIRVKQGDQVTINFTNAGGVHDWVLDEFNAKTKVLQAGQSETITFTASQKGIFEYYCSVPGHREGGMVGKLIVE